MAKEIPLTQGKVAIVDDADYEWLNQLTWRLDRQGYAVRSVRSKKGSVQPQYMHRIVLQEPHDGVSGQIHPKCIVDHADGNPLNNQRSNLRICSPAESNQNRGRHSHKTSSVYKGVFREKKQISKPWRTLIAIDGKLTHIGYFATEIEAAKAYNDAAIKHHGEFARLNEIPTG